MIFCLIILLSAEIPQQYQKLADKAIHQSKVKTTKSKSYESMRPGKYEFENFQFTLKRTCMSPSIKEIKGYAIDENDNNDDDTRGSTFIAIVKQNVFNLPHNFTFLDPKNKQIYEISSIVGSDDKVDIYKANKLTLFDIITDFKYHRKTTKELKTTIKDSIFWNSTINEPITTEIAGLNESQIGCGGFGIFNIDFKAEFKSKYDLMIQTSFDIDIELSLLAKLQKSKYGNHTKNILSNIDIQIPELSCNVYLLDVEFAIDFNLLLETSIDKINISIPEEIRAFKGYKYNGKKTLKITNFEVFDSPWQITKSKISDNKSQLLQVKKCNTDFLLSQIFSAFKFELNVKIDCLDFKSSLKVGLKIPININLERSSSKMINPHSASDFKTSLTMFYNFEGINYNDLRNNINLIKPSSNEVQLIPFDMGKSYTYTPKKVHGNKPKNGNYNSTRTYLIENKFFHWASATTNAVKLTIVGTEKNNGNSKTSKIFPYQGYSTNGASPTYLNSFMMFTTKTAETAPVLSFYFNIMVTKVEKILKKKRKWYGKVKKYYVYNYYDVEEKSTVSSISVNADKDWPISHSYTPTMTHGSNVLKGNTIAWICRNITSEKVFSRENNSIVITSIPGDGNKRVLLSIDSNGKTRIDEKATFYYQSADKNQLTSVGLYQSLKQANYEPLVAIKTTTTSVNEVLTHVCDKKLDKINGTFSVEFKRNQTYKFINITSKYPVKNTYLIIKKNDFIPIATEMIRLANDIYAIYTTNNNFMFPIKRESDLNDENVTFEYLITQIDNINNMNFNTKGEKLNFTRTNTAKAFIIPFIHGNYYFFIDKPHAFSYYTMDVDDENKIMAIIQNDYDKNKNHIYTLLNSYAIFSENELIATFDPSLIETHLTNKSNSYNIAVICESEDIKSVRCGSKVEELINGEATFTFHGKENKILEFYAVCKDYSGSMCEISFTPKIGEYHLFSFPTREGINITNRGMKYGIIPAERRIPIGFYKQSKGPVEYIRSYAKLTNIKVELNDVIPNKDKTLLLEDSDSFSDPYRNFCVYDSKENQIPFSTKLISEHLDSFMKSIGASPDYGISDYIMTSDGCIQVKLDIIKDDHNSSNCNFETNIVDLGVDEITCEVTIKPNPTTKPTQGQEIITTPNNRPTIEPIIKPTNEPIITFDPNQINNIKTIKLNKANDHSSINTSQIDHAEIICPKSTVFFIHYMKNHIISVYNSKNELIASINENDKYKIVNFGESDGKIIIKKISNKSNQFIYSYIILNDSKIKDLSTKCDNIYISSDSESQFTIKSPTFNTENYDYALPNENNFCVWFTFPSYSSINSNINLPHSQILIVDDVQIDVQSTKIEAKGYNFLYMLLNTSKGNNFETAVFQPAPGNSIDLENIVSYEVVNNFYHINSENTILVPYKYIKDVNKKIPTEENKSGKNKKMICIIGIVVCACLIVIAVLITVVVVLVKRNKNEKGNIENNDCADSVSDPHSGRL